MKKVEVTSCSHSQGWPIVRVTTSQNTEVTKPARQRPPRIMVIRSSTSKQGHFKWRCACRTILCGSLTAAPSRRQKEAGKSRPLAALLRSSPQLLDGAREGQDLHRVRPELLGDLILQWL